METFYCYLYETGLTFLENFRAIGVGVLESFISKGEAEEAVRWRLARVGIRIGLPRGREGTAAIVIQRMADDGAKEDSGEHEHWLDGAPQLTQRGGGCSRQDSKARLLPSWQPYSKG